MAKKKTKPKLQKVPRAPRQVWLVVSGTRSAVVGAFALRRQAKDVFEARHSEGARLERVVGPYVLAERVRES
jgi:hypothetical protein